MALANDKNQGENLESTSIENTTGIKGSTDLSNLDTKVSKEQLAKMEASVPSLKPPTDPPNLVNSFVSKSTTNKTTQTSRPMSSVEAQQRRKYYNVDEPNNTNPQPQSPVSDTGDFLANMAAISKPDTAISRPINQDINFDEYKDYLPKNRFYYDNGTQLDKTRALNQSNWEQAAYATGRTLVNVIPEAIKQVANALDVEDWVNSNDEIGNAVADAMTSFQTDVKDAMPIYRENPNKSLDVGDFAYWMETGESLVTTIGGYAIAGYALAGITSIPGKLLNAVAEARATSIAKKVADGIRGSSKFQAALNAAKANQVGTRLEGLALNFLMNQSESVGIAADVYKNVYTDTYNNAIVAGKTEAEAKEIGKKAAAIGAAGSMNFNRLNMFLNTTSSDLFLRSPAAISGVIKKEGLLHASGEMSKEALEEYVNDLGQIYGENLNTDTPLTFKGAVKRLGTAEGIESPILGAIGGIGQPALTKAGKYIQTSSNESYMRHFNQYLMDNPMTESTKEASIQAATAYAQTQASKDKPLGIFTNKQPAGYTTSTAQQLESLYVAQQAALADYDKASKDDKLLDVVNSSLSAEFTANLLNQIQSDPTLPLAQKNNLLERALLSHQAFKSLEIGTIAELKTLYKTYATMDEDTARSRNILTNEKEGEPEHYKTKANEILKTLDVYEENYRISKSFLNSTEVYDKLNNSYFNNRDINDLTKKHDSKLGELDDIIVTLHTTNNNTEALLALEESRLTGKIIVPAELENSKLAEETKDISKALKIAKDKQLANTLELQDITSEKYTKELAEYINLYRNKQIAEKNKAKTTKTVSNSFGNIFKKKNQTAKRKENKENQTDDTTVTPPVVPVAPIVPQQQTTNKSSNTGKSQPTDSLFTYDTSDIQGSQVMNDYLNGDTNSIVKMLTSKFSLDTKIAKLKEHIDNKINYDSKNLQAVANDGEEVVGKIVKKLQTKLKELEDYKENLAPDVVEANEAFDSTVTDFALDLEEDNIDSPAVVDETTNQLEPFNKNIIDAKYDIYSSILEQMGKRGIDTSNYEEVMTEFKTILGTRLLKSQYNSLQALFNLANNTNESQSYKDLFDTLEDIDNDIEIENKLAKVTLPDGTFHFDIDEESRLAMQNTKQSIIVNNPNAEVKGIAYPIYNETGSNVLAYLSQHFNKLITRRINPAGQEYYEIDKNTINAGINEKLNADILEDNYFAVGDTITFLPLESYTDDSGNIVMASELPVNERPIGVVHNGLLLDGVYLHNVSWITAENINNTPANIENDKATLIALRNKIINGEQVITTITDISPGAPISLPNNGIATFASEFEEFPVGIVKNGQLETSDYNIPIPEYLHFNEGSIVTKVNDYFYYGSRTRLFAPMKQAIITGLKAFALGQHNDGTKALISNGNLDILKGKGLQNYVSKLVNTSSIKVNGSYPTDLETFKDALNTRPENEVIVNFIKGAFYIGRGGALDVFVIEPSSFKGSENVLDEMLLSIKELLDDSFANVSMENLKSNNPLLIIHETGVAKTFPTYDNYIKHVSTSSYGSIVLPSGNKITTIQKRINFDLPLVENKTNNLISTTTKKGRPKKIQETIKDIENAIDLFSDVTEEDLSPEINNKKVILPIGTSGSGKSTWIKSLPKDLYTIISPDEMRVEFTGNINDKSKDVEIYEAVKTRTLDAINNGKQVIIDSTNLQKDRRRDFINTIKAVRPDVSLEYKLMELNPELAKQRIKAQIDTGENRANVPDSTIDRHTLLYKEMLKDIKEESIIPFDTEENLAPIVEEKLTSPSLIDGLSNAMQKVIVNDIVQDYYGLHLQSKDTGERILPLEEFFNAKTDMFDIVLKKAKEANYKGYDKLATQVEIIKTNKAKILEIVRQNLTRQLGITVNEKSFIIENTNDEQNSNEENVDAPEGSDIEDATERDRIYDLNEFSIDPKLDMSNAVKYLLYGIVDVQMKFEEINTPTLNVNGELVNVITNRRIITPRKTALQIPVRVNPNVVYQDLLKLFSKSSDNIGLDTTDFAIDPTSKLIPKMQVAIQILESLYTTQPYYANVVTKLKNLDELTQHQFIRTFNKNNTEHIKVVEYSNKDGESLNLRIIKNSTQNALNELIRKWDINLKSLGGYNPTDNGTTLSPTIYNAFVKYYNGLAGNSDLHTYSNFAPLFKLIGIELSIPAFESLRNGTYVNGRIKTINQHFEHADGWLRRLKNRMDFMMETDINGNPLHKDIDILYKDKVFKEIGNFLMNFDKSSFNTSHKNSNGDTIWGVTNNRYFMERVIGLKSNPKLLKNLYNNAFSSSSEWLRNLYNKHTGSINKSDFHLDFSFNTIDGYTSSANNKSKLVSSLNRKELIQMSLSLFFNNRASRLDGSIPIHRFIIPALSDKANTFTVQAQGRIYNLVNGRLSDTDLNFLRTQFFDGEFNRILNTQNKETINVKGYNEGGVKFLLFPKFNDIKSLWINGTINPEALNAENSNNSIAEINEVIQDYVIDGLHTNYNKWKSLGLLKEGKDGVYNDKMVFIDKAFSDENKKNPRITMQEATSLALNYTVNYLVANANMQQLIFNDPAFYYKKGKMNDDNTAQITSDIEETWDNASKRYAAVNGGKEEFQFPAGSTFSVLSIQDTKLQSNNHEYLSQLWAGHPDLDMVLDKNSSIENGDAQEYTSLKEHLDRMVYSSTLDRDTATRILKTYNKTGTVSKEDLGIVLIPFKPLYFNTYMDKDGIMKTLYIKTSSLPLIKQFTKGLQIDNLREFLDNPKNKVDVAVFASGIKAGNPINSLPLFSKEGNINSELLKGKIEQHIIRNIPREGHGNQQANPDKSKKTEINDGTQQAKLLFTNILDVLGFKNPFATSDKDSTVDGRTLANIYLKKYETRFKIQYEKLMKELDVKNGRIGNTNKLKSILTKEAISKGWTFNEAASFELDESGLNFDIPLWLSISSSKIENLLSSIVDNRIRKRKRFGRSFILASDAGIRTFDKNVDIKDSGITFLDTFKGELKNSYNENGRVVSADILIPFRFYDNNGELLKIKNFIKEDGTLDTETLPVELLQGFGFRIPTSGLNLMNNIRIVGFLPDFYGDVIIAPADFTIQMGSDFDVDKFYTNTYATYYDAATGTLEKLGNKHKEERQVILDTIFKLNNDAKRLKNYKGKSKAELLADNRKNKKIQESKPLYKLKNLDILIIDNEILDIQRAVLDNPDKEIQRARTKPLSFGRLQEMIEKFGIKGTKEYFTFLDRNVQDENYISGNLGKTAISNFSLDMILNSLGQYSTSDLYFQYKVPVKGGFTYKPVIINAFGFRNNNINAIKLNDRSGRNKSDVLEGLMAASLDNGKEKILGKLNISDSTFNFIRAMVASGYNEEVIMGVINQPIVKSYLDPATSSFVRSLLDTSINNLSYENRTTLLNNTSLSDLTHELDTYDTENKEAAITKAFTGAVKDGVSQKPELDLQLAILSLFKTMDKNGQALAQVRSALGVDSTGVGKNVIYSHGKSEQRIATMENKTIANVSQYFKSIYQDENGMYQTKYSAIGNSALKYAVDTNITLWSKFFPFNNEVIQDIITTIAERTGKDIFRLNSYSDYATLVLKDFKSFLSAKQLVNAVPAFMKGMNSQDIYKSIIYNTKEHESLGEFILNLRDNTDNNVKYTNDLLNSLSIDAIEKSLVSNVNPTIINIGYSNINKIDSDENDIVNSLIEMINNPVPLGIWNNNSITSKDLAHLLILHQLYSKGVPSSTKFIQYIPVAALKRLGYYDQMSETFREVIDVPAEDISILAKQFLLQHLQHNMKDYYDAKLDRAYRDYFVDGVFVGATTDNLPARIVFKEGGQYYTQYKVGNGFIRLNPLGWGDNTEYNHDIMNPISLNFKNNISMLGVKEYPSTLKYKEITSNFETKALPFTAIINSTIGKKTSIPIDAEISIIGYPIQLTENGTTTDFFLTKNGNSYNSLYHPITGYSVAIEGLKLSNTKEERDSILISALSTIPLEVLNELQLTNAIETINIKSIEDNLETFMTIGRDKSEDVFPDEINATTKSFVEELGLNDNSLNLEDKYNLIFNVIQKTNGKSNPILKYFLSTASSILPIINNVPIVLDYNLKSKGSYKSNAEYGYIAINPTKFNTIEEMAAVVAEEAIHALFKKQIKVNNAITKDLEKLRKEVEDLLVAEYGEQALIDMKTKLVNRTPLTKGVESELLYSIYNLDEFIAAVLTKPEFQTYLNSKEIKIAKKTLWQKLLELMTGILRMLGVNENTKLADALGGVIALTNDIRDNHLANIPKAKYERSLEFINTKFNLVSNTNELIYKGNADEITKFINENFAGVKATTIEENFVEVTPISFSNYSFVNITDLATENLAPDDWSLESLEFAGINLVGGESTNKEIRADYYQYASSLRARIIQGEKKLRKAKVEGDPIKIEELNTRLLQDKVDLMSVPKLKNLTDFALKAKEDLEVINKIFSNPMNSEDIIYSRNILNFWADVIEYSFTDKHKESEELMRKYNLIQNEANAAIKRLELIEKQYLEDFIKSTLGREVSLTDMFKNYKDIWSIQANTRDISTYDNELLNAIWKKIQFANMEAEEESNNVLTKLNSIIDKIMPKLRSINPTAPYEIFRQLSENGEKTNHLINRYSTKFYKDKGRAYNKAKEAQTSIAANAYASWVRTDSKPIDLFKYFENENFTEAEAEANRLTLKAEVGDYAYNLWFNGQNRKINSYNKRKQAIEAIIKTEFKLDLDQDLALVPEAVKKLQNWEKKHSPFEFSKIVNATNYKYYDGVDGIDGFRTYEVLPKKAEHFNDDFNIIAADPELIEFYTEFSEIYENLKTYVPASQLSSLMYGGLPVIEKSIYQLFSTGGLKVGFKGIEKAWTNSITSSYKDNAKGEFDLVTQQNAKQMHIPGVISNGAFITNYINSKSVAYEIKTGKLPTVDIIAKFREEATAKVAEQGDFDLGKLMKIFGTLVLSHKHIAAIEDLTKIAQYTLNSYQESEFNPDGSKAFRNGGAQSKLPVNESFINTKKALTYTINATVYGEVKQEEGRLDKKILTPEEKELRDSYTESLLELQDKFDNGEVTEDFYNNLKDTIETNIDKLGSNIVASKVGDNWLKMVQLKLMGWNVLGGFSNSAFGFIGNMIEAAGEGSFTLAEMTNAYKMTTASIAKNLTFNKWEAGESAKIRNAMNRLNVLKEASHELFTSNDSLSFGDKFKFASPYNMNQRTEYLNQAPIMIIYAKKTMVDTKEEKISIWDGMDENWEWDVAKYGELPTRTVLDMRVAITKQIQRTHGNYDPNSPLMVKEKFVGRALSQFRTWLYESVAVRFEKERFDDGIQKTVKGRYNTLAGIIFENEGRINIAEGGKEFGKAMLNAFTFGALKLESFKNTNLSEIDEQNMRKVAMELVLLLDIYILIALLKAGLSDDDDEAKAMYNVLLNQGTRLKSDLLLYVNPSETRNILRDIVPSVSLYDDIAKLGNAVMNLEDDEIKSGVHKGNSRLGTAIMKNIPGSSKVYSTYNSMSQLYDKSIDTTEDEK